MYEVEIYEDENGKSEVYDYISKLQKSTSKSDRIKLKKIDMYIRLLERNGLSMGKNYIKHIDKELWEIRPIRDRILFGVYKENIFVLLSVFMKKTRKTPSFEIEKAKRNFKKYKIMKEDKGYE